MASFRGPRPLYCVTLERFVFVLLLVLCGGAAVGPDGGTPGGGTGTDKNSTSGGKSPQQTGHGLVTMTPLEQSMQPVYILTNFFLSEVVQPQKAGPPKDIIKLLGNLLPLSDRNLSSADSQQSFIENITVKWQTVSLYYLGFAICIIVGLIFMVVMPIVGFCFCCCRVCGNCGGKASQMDSKYARCKRASFSLILLLIVTIMLAGVVCAFVTNELLYKQMSDPDRGYISNVNRSLLGAQQYIDTTATELRTNLMKEFNRGADQLEVTINGTGSVVLDAVGKITDAGPLLDNMTSLADDIPVLILDFELLQTQITDLKAKGSQLETDLNSIASDVKSSLVGCTQQPCTAAKSTAEQLKLAVDFNSLPDVGSIINSLNQAKDLGAKVSEARTSYEQISTEVAATVKGQTDQVILELGKTKTEIDDQLAKVEKKLKDYNKQMDPYKTYLNQAQPQAAKYSQYLMFVGIGLSCILLLIVVLVYLGLMFGVCGERAYDDARFCNKGIGANFLMAAVGFMFLFSTFLMLITTVLFTAGAPLQTEVCRHIMKPTSSPLVLEIDEYVNIGQIIFPNSSDTLTFHEILGNCENNTAIYSALKLWNIFNVSDVVEKALTETKAQIDRLKADIAAQSTITNVNLMPSNTRTLLDDLGNSPDYNKDYSKAIADLSKDLVAVDIRKYISDLETLKSMGAVDQGPLDNAIATLRRLEETDIPAMNTLISQLKASLDKVLPSTSIPVRVAEITSEVDAIQSKLNTDQSKIFSEAADTSVKEILGVAVSIGTSVIYQIENNIGRCRPLYNSYSNVVASTCINVLNPYNGFWFAFGLCLFFFIPAIIFCVKLAGLYRKTDKYAIKDFDDPDGNNYQGIYPGDNIPLDDVRNNPKHYRDGRGLQNTGYDRGSDRNPDRNGAAPTYDHGVIKTAL